MSVAPSCPRSFFIAALMLGLSTIGVAQTPPKRSAPPRDTLSDSVRATIRKAARDAREETRKREMADTGSIRARAAAAAPTAFADDNARMILGRARDARERQDSALIAYRAKATQRISVSMGVRKLGMDKVLFRGDNVAMVSWQRGVGVWVKPIGSRMTVPMGEGSGDFYQAISVPYFPGREQLWFPSSEMGMVRSDINEREMIHPLARGSEAYYRYATGDSVDITLPGGQVIHIRELRITARKPDWRLFVGSFWFDRESGQVVRAAYRLAVDLELWDIASEESKRDADFNKALATVRDSVLRARLTREDYVKDSSQRARNARNNKNNNDDDAPAWVKALFQPAKAKLDGITVEYGLYEGRFWLPRNNSFAASAQMAFMRVPIEINEKFDYELVNGDMSLPALPAPRVATNAAGRVDTVRASTEVSISGGAGGRADSATSAARRIRADSMRAARNGFTCTKDNKDSSYTKVDSRFDGALRIAYQVPCDGEKLRNSPELPPADVSADDIFNQKAADDLLSLLDLNLQPSWAPERPKLRTGLDLLRYNRVEGFSPGLLVTERLGSGYLLSAVGRIGAADMHANGELSLERSNGRRTVRGTAYHRLSAVNPEWAGALNFGPSLPALLYARDEGFYYRNFGAELVDHREQAGRTLDLRLFVERQWTAGDTDVVNTFSIASAFTDRKFLPNILSERVSLSGVSVDWGRAFAPGGSFLLQSAVRGDAATGTFQFGRAAVDLSASRPIGPVTASLSGSIGNSVGRLPVQHLWYIGGLRTVRGQIAGTQAGNAFWLSRAEVGTRSGIFRPVAFFDIGWAGSRDALGKTQPQRGAGVGFSLLDGLFRMDIARGLYPNKKWRSDLYLQGSL